MSSESESSATTAPSTVGRQASEQVSVSEYRSILTDFLTKSAFVEPPYHHDEEFVQEVIKGCMSVSDPKDRERLARLGTGAIRRFYPSHDRKRLIVLATFTALMFSVDDFGATFPEALRTYRRNIVLGQPQEHQGIADFLKMTLQMEGWLDVYAIDMTFKAQLEFFSANLVEMECGDGLRPQRSTPSFLRHYLRLKTGICEPYALFIFPSDVLAQAGDDVHAPLAATPDIMTWIDDVNDIMSFYKESVVGDEQDNVVNLHARANEMSPLQAVQFTADAATESIARIREFGATQHPAVRKNLEEFLQGYMSFHFSYPRYRLKELDISMPKRA